METRNTGVLGQKAQYAVVYIPSGTYLVGKTLQNYVGTVIMGDRTNQPVLMAASTISGDHLINGAEPKFNSLNGFYHEVENLVLDSTTVAASKQFSLLKWGLGQVDLIQNVQFNMPNNEHAGMITDLNA